MPRFSIVIPTRARSALLDLALTSALSQTYDDYEVVVSANGPDPATDDVLHRHADPRLRVVRPDHPLPCHENWNHALRHAQGEFVHLLCDDDALHPRLLDILAGLLDAHGPSVIAWNLAVYRFPTGTPPTGGELTGGLYSNCVYRCPAAPVLASAFGLRFDEPAPHPRVINALYPRTLLERAVQPMGQYFLPPAPDYSTMLPVLAAIDSYLWLDAPLRVGGIAPQSISASSPHGGAAWEAYLAELGYADHSRWARLVPLTQHTVWNLVTDTMLRTRSLVPALSDHELDWPEYFAGCARMLHAREAAGGDTHSDRAELERALDERGPAFREAVALSVEREPPAPVYDELELVRRGVLPGPCPVYLLPIDARTPGYENIALAAAQLSPWLAEYGCDGQVLADTVLETARSASGGGQLLLVGMGRHGRWLAEALRLPARRAGVRVRWFDDRPRPDHAGEDRLDFEHEPVDWWKTLAVVTPWSDSQLVERLAAAGADPAQHVLTWRQLVARQRPASAQASAEPATPLASA